MCRFCMSDSDLEAYHASVKQTNEDLLQIFERLFAERDVAEPTQMELPLADEEPKGSSVQWEILPFNFSGTRKGFRRVKGSG